MSVYATEENGKLKYVKECLQSLADTVNLNKHTLHIINNNSSVATAIFLISFVRNNNAMFYNLKENLGTACGINLALKERLPNQVCIKTDDDVKWHSSGWVEELEQAIRNKPEIGILGLKRDDVYGEMVEDGNLLWCKDIMGTCTAYNPLLLDKIGYLSQPSNYGFDDSIFSCRSEVSGFKNAFLKDIKITHLDEGGTEYTEWKKREAGIYIDEVAKMCEMYKNGTLDYYYDGQ